MLFAALLVFFQIRHLLNAGDPLAKSSSHVEQGLFAMTSLAFAFVLTRLDLARANPVFRVASLAFGVISAAFVAFGAVPLALLAVFCLELALLPATNAISRRYEAEADWVALEATRDPAAARRLTVRLARASLADPDPPAWAYVLRRTHPTAMQRLAMTLAWEEETRAGAARLSALRRPASRGGS